MSRPVVIFPDVELWAVTWLRSALAARTEPYASDVTVANVVPGTLPARLVWVRRDGGPRQGVALERPRLSVNVYAGTEQDAADLANLVRALIWAAPDGDPVCRVSELSGPSPIADPSKKPRRFMTFELLLRGVQA